MAEAGQQEQMRSKELDLRTDFSEILKAGYTVNLWNTGGSVRVAEILSPGDLMGRPEVSKLGYGADATASKALVRARDSFAKRVAEGKDEMTKDDIKSADAGFMTGAYPDGTYLDGVAYQNEITFYKAGDEVIAKIPTVTGTHTQGLGINMEAALENLESIMGGRTS